jgi:hypothetical protein
VTVQEHKRHNLTSATHAGHKFRNGTIPNAKCTLISERKGPIWPMSLYHFFMIGIKSSQDHNARPPQLLPAVRLPARAEIEILMLVQPQEYPRLSSVSKMELMMAIYCYRRQPYGLKL